MAPGRAPVGFFAAEIGEYTPCFVDERHPVIRASEESGDSSSLTPSHERLHLPSPPSLLSLDRTCASFQVYPDPLSPSILQPPVKTPTPDKSNDLPSYSSSLPLQPSSSSASHFRGRRSYSLQHPISTTTIPHPEPAALDRASSVAPSKTTPASTSSVSSLYTSDMAPYGPSLTSQARAAELNAATAARARYRNGELSDLSELPSSRPISLGALSSRNNSRNKGTKPWKPFPLTDVEESSEPVEPETNKPPVRRPGTQFIPSFHLDTPQSKLTQHPLPTATTSVVLNGSSERNIRNMENRPWFHEMVTHIQRNPLGHFGVLEDIGNNSMSQRYEVPVPNEGKHRDIDRPLAPQDVSPTKQEEKTAYRGIQQNNFFQHDRLFMTAVQSYPYFQDYQVASEMPHLKGPDTSDPFIYPPQQYGQIGFHNHPAQIQAPLPETPDPRYGLQTPVRRVNGRLNADPGLSTMDENPTWTDARPQSHQRGLSTPSQNVIEAIAKCSEERNMSKKTESYDAKREMTAYLNSVVEDSKSNKGKIALDDPFVPKRASVLTKRELGSPIRQNDTSSMRVNSYDPFRSKQESNLPGSQSDSLSDVSKGSSLPPFEGFQSRSKSQRVIFSSDLAKKGGKNLEGLSVTEVPRVDGSIKRPPPGLAHPRGREIWELASFSTGRTSAATERLLEADRWFHSDGRGEKAFRHQVLAIAQEEAARRKMLRGPARAVEDDSLFETKTLLLGNVIANLRSYVVGDRKEQFGNFANFGPVPCHCCEPSHGGRRSYFDSDPSVGQWRLPTGRAFHHFSYRPAERFANNLFARSLIFSK
ncbi:hypothetical protein VTN77DRAFT_3141 [Rasamsonia byssochlamydoides]|uniref:uncharacterized protein n=1 Tax=Rasamsonia byssochlamydoides TaxID=89139 RepID=UPI00374296AC